jgi:hypothetical protein
VWKYKPTTGTRRGGKREMNDENVDGWTKVTKGDGKCARKPVAKRTHIFPTCVNRFSVERINLRLMENRQKGVLKKNMR